MEEGDKCLVFLPDAIVPQRPEYNFMEKYGGVLFPAGSVAHHRNA